MKLAAALILGTLAMNTHADEIKFSNLPAVESHIVTQGIYNQQFPYTRKADQDRELERLKKYVEKELKRQVIGTQCSIAAQAVTVDAQSWQQSKCSVSFL